MRLSITTTLAPVALDRVADRDGEFAGRHLGRVDLAHDQQAGVDMRLEVHAERGRARQQARQALVEQEEGRPLAAPQRRP